MGSEMCIRDRSSESFPDTGSHAAMLSRKRELSEDCEDDHEAVSKRPKTMIESPAVHMATDPFLENHPGSEAHDSVLRREQEAGESCEDNKEMCSKPLKAFPGSSMLLTVTDPFPEDRSGAESHASELDRKQELEEDHEDDQDVCPKPARTIPESAIVLAGTGDEFGNNLVGNIRAGEALHSAASFDADKSRDRVLQILVKNAPPEHAKQVGKDRTKFVSAARQLGNAAAKPVNDGLWATPGMTTPLYSHQVIAAGRMLEIEKKGHGVLLMDMMGLGKTLEALAAITASRPSLKVKLRTTLIIVPPNNYS